MTTGTVKKVVAHRGFGFIAADDAKEYFFHPAQQGHRHHAARFPWTVLALAARQ